MLLELFRWLKGFVQFEARGDHLERFIGLCLKANLFLWRPRKKGKVLQCYMTARDYKKIRPFARESQSRVRLIQKSGFPFILRRYRKRMGLVLGFILSMCALFASSLLLWDVQIMGNGVVQTQELLDFLRDQGVYPGAWKGEIQTDEVEEAAILQFGDLSWIAINLSGGIATVEVRETQPPPPMVDHSRPCNLVAGKQGEIVKVEAYDGVAVVQPGDQVLPGDLLISGVMEDGVGKVTLRQATGQVTAKTRYLFSAQVPLTEMVDQPTGKYAQRVTLRVYGFEIPLFLGDKEPFIQYITSSYLDSWKIFGVDTGISWRTDRYYETQQELVNRDREQAREIAQVLIEKQSRERLGDAKVLGRSFSEQIEDSLYTLTADFLCEERIEIEKEILLGE